MGDDKSLDALIERFYDAALDEKLWPELAPEIAGTFDSNSATVVVQTPTLQVTKMLGVTANMEGAAQEQYQAYYWRHDMWAKCATKLGMGEVFTSEELIPDQELRRTEIYNDWLRGIDVAYLVGSVFPVSDGEICVFGIHRGASLSTFSDRDKQRVSTFLPHLRRALQIRRRLVQPTLERKAALDTLERTGVATLVVADKGHILYATGRAELLLREGDGLKTIAGRLTTGERATTERMLALIQGAITTSSGNRDGSGGALVVQRAARLPLTALIAPFRPTQNGLGAAVPAAILFVKDPETSAPSRAALQGLFGLTATEASVASAIADGKSLEKIAVSYRISLHTARTHLKSVLAKTGTKRQAELVALLLRTVAVLNER